MGRGLAKILAQKGANVILVARTTAKLEEAVKYIKVQQPYHYAKADSNQALKAAAANPQTQRFHYISADVTSFSENERILREATEWNNGQAPDIVWANAGTAHPALFVDTSIEVMRNQMDINYWAAAYLAHGTLRAWLRPSPRDGSSSQHTSTSKAEPLPKHFIMTSSVASFVGLAGYTPYAPAKSALRSLADTLQSEINLYNGARKHKSHPLAAPPIKIHIVFPGTIISPGLENENKTKHAVTHLLEDGDPKQTEDEVAAASIKGLEKGHYMIATQFLGNVLRVSMLGGSPRHGLWGVRDALFSWVTAFVWLFAGPDMEGKVWKWGRENGIKQDEGKDKVAT
jgi:3-dehydrosphinganine reductase